MKETLHTLNTPAGVTLSHTKGGAGDPLVLVHGGLSDHRTNWEFVLDDFRKEFTVYAVARRGRGQTTATKGHGVKDEAADVAALIDSIGQPVNLLGHSYGALTSAEVALRTSNISRLVLYEPPGPDAIQPGVVEHLQDLGARQEWDTMLYDFFHGSLQVPTEELDALKGTEYWAGMVEDAENSLEDFRAVAEYEFDFERFRAIEVPVRFLVGSESPREIYATDRIAAVVKEASIVTLEGQAHEGMTFNPAQFVAEVVRFLKAPAPVAV